MRGLLLLSTLLVLFVSTSIAQKSPEVKAKAKDANVYFKDKSYEKALDAYLVLDSLVDEDEPEYRFRIAVCYLNTYRDKTKAIPYLLDTKNYFYEKGEEESYYFYLGKAYHLSYRFDEAIMAYDKFIKLVSKRDRRVPNILRQIEMCMNGKNLIANAVEVDIENLGPKVNSPAADYTPVISADESVIIFNSRREGSTGGMMDQFGRPDTVNGSYYDDIYVSIKFNESWLKPVSIGSNLNTHGHDGVIGLSPDGQKLFVYRSDSVLYGNIFETRLRGYDWGRVKKLPSPINSKYLESNASVTAEGDVLYFTSNRPKNVGDADKDIYTVRKLPTGDYAAAKNLGSMINTPYEEISPFIHPDGKTLYFSSKGHNSMGGYDIFKTSMDENGNWSIPVNLGHPINTPGDDIDFVLSADGKRGYYASARPGGYGDQDIYVIHFLQEFKDVAPGPVTLLTGSIFNCDQQFPVGASIKVYDEADGNLQAVYRPNEATGKFMIIVPKGANYRFEAEAGGYQTYEWLMEIPLNEGYKEEVVDVVLCKDVDSSCTSCANGSYLNTNVATKEVAKEEEVATMTAMKDIFNTLKNKDVVFKVHTNDVSTDGEISLSSIRTLTTTTNGALDYDQAYGEYDYTPDLGFAGVDSFEYKVCNEKGDCSTAWVRINVKDPSAKNEAPIIADDQINVNKNEETVLAIFANDKDNDGSIDINTLKIEDDVKNGALLIDVVKGEIKYTPNEAYTGTDMFKYRVCDNMGECGSATVILTVEEPALAEKQSFDWEEAAKGEQITLYNVYYNYDKWDLREDSKEPLDELVRFLTKYDQLDIEIGAHSDSRGSSSYNKNLSVKRANSVKNYLVDNKVNGDRIKATGFGEDEPLHKCVTDEACSEEQHQLNRRTTFVLSGGNFKIESIKPDFVKVDPRPGSAYYKQIDESTGVVSEKKAFSMLLQEKPEVTMPGLKFRVQVAAYNIDTKTDDPNMQSIVGLKVEKVHNTLYRYMSTPFNNISQANKYAEMLKKTSFPKAFVVAYYNGQKISMVKLKELLGN